MAKFLETQAISNELMRLIKDAKEKIVLVTYSVKVNPQIQERLRTKSKSGQMSEIVFIHGRLDLKDTELEWMKEIDDLKIYEKSNLHAKCYLNEDRAIVCSMNLYDYSQQNNIEMGVLLTKQEDPEAFDELVKEITHIKVNATRKKLDELLASGKSNAARSIAIPSMAESRKLKYAELDIYQKLKFQVLRNWRLEVSRDERIAAYQILTDEELLGIVTMSKIEKNALYNIASKKNVIKYGDEIIDELKSCRYYTIGLVTNTVYQSASSSYDRVKFKFENGNEEWFDTTQELPAKNKTVAVKLNKSWFNEYLYLES